MFLDTLLSNIKWSIAIMHTENLYNLIDKNCNLDPVQQQGLIHGPVDLDRKMTESVECDGSEELLEKCSIRYTSKTSTECDLNKVWK